MAFPKEPQAAPNAYWKPRADEIFFFFFRVVLIFFLFDIFFLLLHQTLSKFPQIIPSSHYFVERYNVGFHCLQGLQHLRSSKEKKNDFYCIRIRFLR